MCCDFCQYQLQILPIRRVVPDSIDKRPVFPESALVLPELEQIQDIRVSFNSPGWLLWWLLSNSRIISPFWEKDITAWYFFRESQPNKWIEVEKLGRKGWVSFKRPKQKGTGSKAGISGGFLEIPTIWIVLVLWGRAGFFCLFVFCFCFLFVFFLTLFS